MGDVLQHAGGIEKNSFINVLHADTDNDDDEIQIISHSPYYDIDNLISTLIQTNNKNY